MPTSGRTAYGARAVEFSGPCPRAARRRPLLPHPVAGACVSSTGEGRVDERTKHVTRPVGRRGRRRRRSRCRAASGPTSATISGTRSIRGPGSDVSVAACAQGPASSRCGTPLRAQRLDQCGTSCCGSRRPSRRRSSSGRRCGRSRAGPSRAASTRRRAARRSQVSSHGSCVVDPAPPLVPPAVAPQRRHRRQRVHRRHVVAVVDQVEQLRGRRRGSARRRCSGRRCA